MSLTPDQLERYARHIMLREIGGPGQQKLLAAHVAIVGLGALGGPAALHLAAAGVGKLTLIDDDLVSLSNLQRQVLFRTQDIGELKTAVALKALNELNPGVEIERRSLRLTQLNAPDLFEGADVVIDGTDNFATRFAINLACHKMGIPMVSGAVGRWAAQVSVFKSGTTKGQPAEDRLPCYRCLVTEAPENEETCEVVGVIGPLTGFVGTRLALEAVKEITGAGTSLAGRLVVFDGLDGESRTIRLRADPACSVCGKA